MNPIIQQLNHQQSLTQQTGGNDDISKLLQGIKDGTVDVKTEVLNRISSASPQMKARYKIALPMIGMLAKKYGFSDSDINSFSKALQEKL